MLVGRARSCDMAQTMSMQVSLVPTSDILKHSFIPLNHLTVPNYYVHLMKLSSVHRKGYNNARTPLVLARKAAMSGGVLGPSAGVTALLW